MEIAAAKAERADGGTTRVIATWQPRTFLGVDIKRAGNSELDGLIDFNGRGQNFVMERQSGLDESGGACRRFGVADLRFYRPHGAPGFADAVGLALSKDLTQGRQFGRITRARPSAMRFH